MSKIYHPHLNFWMRGIRRIGRLVIYRITGDHVREVVFYNRVRLAVTAIVRNVPCIQTRGRQRRIGEGGGRGGDVTIKHN